LIYVPPELALLQLLVYDAGRHGAFPRELVPSRCVQRCPLFFRAGAVALLEMSWAPPFATLTSCDVKHLQKVRPASHDTD